MRRGRWKLDLVDDLLYDIDDDPAESTPIHNTGVRDALTAYAAAMRQTLGDRKRNISGNGVRPPGRVDDPVTLLPRHHDEQIDAAYD